MGLSGPRKRVKISHDPNNTRWTSSQESFGRKIMTAQGWSTGQLLGPQNAPHAEHHTKANASHIRVLLREDNLGLGAKVGGGLNGECTGLDVLQDILGRLNGKSENAIEKEGQARADFRRSQYVDKRWGAPRFISGGLLEGTNTIRPTQSEDAAKIKTLEPEGFSNEDNTANDSPEDKTESKLKKKRRKKDNQEIETANGDSVTVQTIEIKREKKSKEKKKKKKKKPATEDAEQSDLPAEKPATSSLTVVAKEIQQTRVSGRHPSRARAMRQKRLTTTDEKSMREILMIKG